MPPINKDVLISVNHWFIMKTCNQRQRFLPVLLKCVQPKKLFKRLSSFLIDRHKSALVSIFTDNQWMTADVWQTRFYSETLDKNSPDVEFVKVVEAFLIVCALIGAVVLLLYIALFLWRPFELNHSSHQTKFLLDTLPWAVSVCLWLSVCPNCLPGSVNLKHLAPDSRKENACLFHPKWKLPTFSLAVFQWSVNNAVNCLVSKKPTKPT